MSTRPGKVQRVQELRRSSAASPHVTKEITDREAIDRNQEEWDEQDSC